MNRSTALVIAWIALLSGCAPPERWSIGFPTTSALWESAETLRTDRLVTEIEPATELGEARLIQRTVPAPLGARFLGGSLYALTPITLTVDLAYDVAALALLIPLGTFLDVGERIARW
ncbi:MAG: hypothetical protein KDC38_09010 [Planctomycetes bacterium]|nr:hypothetical protein [Planctomycetota bacterium]